MISKYQIALTLFNKHNQVWSGLRMQPEYGADINVGQLALERLMEPPARYTEICAKESISCTNYQMALLAKRFAIHLGELGIEQGDIIGICADNTPYLTPLVIGAFLKGLTISTLDPSLDISTIKHIYNTTRPTLMFCDGDNYLRVKQAFQEIDLSVKIFTMIDHIPGVPNINEFSKPHRGEKMYKGESLKYGPTQTAAIVCTSGTTGLPKCVCVSYHCLVNRVNFPFEAGSVILCFSKIHCITCLGCIIGNICSRTTRIVARGTFDPLAFLKLIFSYMISCVIVNHSQLAAILALPEQQRRIYKMDSVKKCVVINSAVPFELVRKIKPYLPKAAILTCYALTETGGIISEGSLIGKGSSGQLKINTDVKLLTENGSEVGALKIAEICIRTIYKWSGYYGNAEATSNVQDAEGWLHTGDFGFFDKNGNLFLIDRIRDIIQYATYTISPSIMEAVLYQLKGVKEVSVFGIPDAVAGHLPAAAIVRLPNHEGENLTAVKAQEHVITRLPFSHYIRGGVYFLTEFPKTTTGKNIRHEIAKICIREYMHT